MVVGMAVVALAQPKVVFNKYQNNNDNASPAPIKLDGYVVEILVIQDNYDLRKVLIKDFSTNGTADAGGGFAFTSNALWSSVRSGTLIVLRKNDNPVGDDVSATDFLLDISMSNTTYIADSGLANFRPGLPDYLMMRKANQPRLGTNNWIHVFQVGNVGEASAVEAAIKTAAAARVSGGETADTLRSGPGAAPVGQFCYAKNSTSVADNYIGGDATGGVLVNEAGTALEFGVPNNATNATFINALRSAVTAEDPAYVRKNELNVTAYPSPVAPGPTTTVSFNLLTADVVGIELVDLSGRTVAQPLAPRQFGAGEQQVQVSIPAGFTEGLHYLRVTAQNSQRQGFSKLLIINW
jgi:hypothetical protein